MATEDNSTDRMSKRIDHYINALVLAFFARALESGLVPTSRSVHSHAVEGLSSTICSATPRYCLAAGLAHIVCTAIEKVRGPCATTINLRYDRGRLLEAAGEQDAAIDAYKCLARDCRSVLRTSARTVGPSTPGWPAGVPAAFAKPSAVMTRHSAFSTAPSRIMSGESSA